MSSRKGEVSRFRNRDATVARPRGAKDDCGLEDDKEVTREAVELRPADDGVLSLSRLFSSTVVSQRQRRI